MSDPDLSEFAALTEADGLRKTVAELQAKLAKATAAPALGDPVSETEKLKAEVKQLKASISKARNEDVREQRVIDTLERLVPTAERVYTPAPRPTRSKRKAQTLVLQLSDLHAGEVVSLEQTSGLNEYDWTIMLARLDRLRERLLSWRDVFGDVEKLVLACNGDNVSGDIHDELVQTNEVPLDEAVVRLGMDLGAWIESLIPEFPKIETIWVDGNHARRQHKPKSKNRYSNADWQVAHFTRLHLRKTAVEFTVPRASRLIHEVYGRKLMLVHGDGVRSSMPGVPWGGWKRRTEALRGVLEADHVLLGHYHEVNVGFGGRIFINGSLVGPSEYGIDNYGGGDQPRQQLIPFHPDHGAGGALWLDVA